MTSSSAIYLIAGFYFFYFAFVGAYAPFWGLYLQNLKFSAFEISLLLSLSQIMRIIAPLLWGWLADHRGERKKIIVLASWLSCLAFACVLIRDDFIWLFLCLGVMSFFWSATLPLVEASTLELLKTIPGRYGRVRLWGSVGFIISSLAVGFWLDHHSQLTLPWIILGLMVGIVLCSLLLKESTAGVQTPQPPSTAETLSLWQVLRQPACLTFFMASFLMACAHGPYYTFLSLYLKDTGYGQSAIGMLWTVGVISEIIIFILIPKLTQACSLKTLGLMALGCAVIRFAMIGWGISSFSLIFIAQVLHAATFGLQHSVSVLMIQSLFPTHQQVRGQALNISFSFGLGGSLGGLLSGMAWEKWGGAWVFTAASGVAALGMLVFFFQQAGTFSNKD